jgi:thiol-disulfide isomerase/thioredoxin
MNEPRSFARFLKKNWSVLAAVALIGGVWFGGRELRGRPSDPPPVNDDVPADLAAYTEGGGLIAPPLGATSSRPRLVEFYTDSCPACRAMRPAVERIAEDCNGGSVEVLLVNLSDPRNEHLAARYSLVGVPTVSMLGVDGAEVGRMQGIVSLRSLRRAAAQLADIPCGGQDGTAELPDGDDQCQWSGVPATDCG